MRNKNKKCSRRYCKAQYIKFEKLIEKEAQKPVQERDSSLLFEYIQTAELYRDAYLNMSAERKAFLPVRISKGLAFAAVAAVLIIAMGTAGEVTGTFRVWSAIRHMDAGYLSPDYKAGKNGKSANVHKGMAFFSEYHCKSVKAAKAEVGINIPLPDDIDEYISTEKADVYVVSDAGNIEKINSFTAEIRGKTCEISVLAYSTDEEAQYALSTLLTDMYSPVRIAGKECKICENTDGTTIVFSDGHTVYRVYSKSRSTAESVAEKAFGRGEGFC